MKLECKLNLQKIIYCRFCEISSPFTIASLPHVASRMKDSFLYTFCNIFARDQHEKRERAMKMRRIEEVYK